MKDRGMLILLVIFGILCISVKVIEEETPLPLLERLVRLENKASDRIEAVTDDDSLAENSEAPVEDSTAQQTATEAITSEEKTDWHPQDFQILHTETSQKIRVLLSAEHTGTYLQPKIVVTADKATP